MIYWRLHHSPLVTIYRKRELSLVQLYMTTDTKLTDAIAAGMPAKQVKGRMLVT